MNLRIVCAVALASITWLSCGWAQQFPSKPIRLVVPFPPGASADITARVVTESLTKQLGQPAVVENKPGAAGYLGLEYGYRQEADGHTLILTGQALSAPPPMFPMEGFDPKRLTSVRRVSGFPLLLVVNSDLPVRSLPDFIAYARNNRNKLNVGTVPVSGYGLAITRLVGLIDAGMTEVPFNGSAPITAALLGKQIELGLVASGAMPMIDAGKLRAIAVASKSRWSRTPNVATTFEQGVKFENGNWFGISVPTGTPVAVIGRLDRALDAAVRDPANQEQLRKAGVDPILDSSQKEMDDAIAEELAANLAVYKAPTKKPN